jgi:phage-related minor tail protein
VPAKGVLRIKILGDAKGVDSAVGVAVDKLKAGALLMGSAFIAGIGKTLDVEAATDRMSASLGLTAKESERLGGVAGKLYSNAYGESMQDVTTAVEAVVGSIRGMRDANASVVEDMTAKAMNLATAFELDVARGAQVAGQMITTGMARDGAHAMDLLTAALQRVPKAVREDLLDAIDEYGPFLKNVGLTGERAMMLLVRSAQKGMYGIDKTGDAIKEFTIRATDMSTASKAGFDAMGMSQEEMAGKILKGGRTAAIAFDQIVKGLLSIKDPVAQSQAAIALFGVPLEDLSVSEIPKFLQGLLNVQGGLGKVEGAAERMGTTLNDNAKGNLTTFWRTLEMGFVNILGGYVIPAITAFVGWLNGMLGPAIRAIGSFISTVIVPALSALFGWISRNSDAIGFLASMIAGGLAAFYAYRGIVFAITSISKIWKAVTTGMTIAQWALNIAMRANPIGIIITLVGALVGGIVYLWNKSAGFRNFFIGVWNGIKRVVGAVVGAILGAIQAVVDAVQNAISWVQNLLDTGSDIEGAGRRAAAAAAAARGGGRARGGPVARGIPVTVGEAGRELFVPGADGMIVPHAATEQLIARSERESGAALQAAASGGTGSGGSVTVVNHFHFPNYLGSKEDLTRQIRHTVRTRGRGSADRLFRPGVT